MDRLTSNKEVSEMNMLELAHNSCYAKDGCVWYRDYDADINARRLAIELLEKLADTPNEFTCDDDFDGFMYDALQDGLDDTVGLIAVFYRNLWAMADLRERLAEYEDLDEQGKLLRLPVAIGDTVYALNIGDADNSVVNEYRVEEVSTHRIWVDSMYYDHRDIGKTVFLTEKEAEAALTEMEKQT